MSMSVSVLERRHPANHLPLLPPPRLCETCVHFDETEGRCNASRGRPSTSSQWPACARFRAARFARMHQVRDAFPWTPWFVAGSALLGYPLSLLLR